MKNFLIWLGKVALMIALLAAAAIVWFFIISFQNGFFSSGPSVFEVLFDIVFIIATIVFYIFLCVKTFRPNNKNSHKLDNILVKAAKPIYSAARITVIVAVICTAVYFVCYLYIHFNGL